MSGAAEFFWPLFGHSPAFNGLLRAFFEPKDSAEVLAASFGRHGAGLSLLHQKPFRLAWFFRRDMAPFFFLDVVSKEEKDVIRPIRGLSVFFGGDDSRLFVAQGAAWSLGDQ